MMPNSKAQGEKPWNSHTFLRELQSSLWLYELGVWKGEVLLHSKFASRYFPYASQEKARKWVLKYGIAAFFLSKFIPGLNSLIIVFGGIFKYDKTWAYIGIGAASTLHNIAFFMAGRFVGGHWEKIGAFLASYNRIVITAALAGLALYFCFWLWKRKRKKAIRDSEE
jgi:membrane protein DedA with SNARE-associated domain